MIRNIVFDIGNVVTLWDPQLICTRAFGEERATHKFVQNVFKDPIWKRFNLGQHTAVSAKNAYQEKLGFTQKEVDKLFFHLWDTQELVAGTVSLMERLKAASFTLFALTDNTRETEAYLRQRYDFWQHFEGVVNSANVGHLKPSPEIYNHLLNGFDLVPEQTVFLDDMPHNVEGAHAMQMHAIHFKTALQAERELTDLGLQF